MPTSERSFNESVYRPGVPTLVSIVVVPDGTTSAWALEENMPIGCMITDYSSNGGTLDSVNHKIKWGPFFDNTSRTFTYKITPITVASGDITFDGIASFDGDNLHTGGSTILKLDKIPPLPPQ